LKIQNSSGSSAFSIIIIAARSMSPPQCESALTQRSAG
jgi:hypothetical protein